MVGNRLKGIFDYRFKKGEELLNVKSWKLNVERYNLIIKAVDVSDNSIYANFIIVYRSSKITLFGVLAMTIQNFNLQHSDKAALLTSKM